MDGVEVVRRPARMDHRSPIIVLSARDAQRDKVNALDAGADDYVTKPFGMDELLARVRAALRRARPDRASARSSRPTPSPSTSPPSGSPPPTGDGPADPTEWHLLEILVRHPGQLVTQQPAAARRSGARRTRPRPTTCASTWPSFARKLETRPLPPAPPHHRTRPRLPLRPVVRPAARTPDSPSSSSSPPQPADKQARPVPQEVPRWPRRRLKRAGSGATDASRTSQVPSVGGAPVAADSGARLTAGRRARIAARDKGFEQDLR